MKVYTAAIQDICTLALELSFVFISKYIWKFVAATFRANGTKLYVNVFFLNILGQIVAIKNYKILLKIVVVVVVLNIDDYYTCHLHWVG